MKFNVGDIVKHKLADLKMVVVTAQAGDKYVCRWMGKHLETGEKVFFTDTFLENELQPYQENV